MTPMSKGEREELKSLTRQRARVAKGGAEARAAAVLADVEAQLAAVYKADDEAFRDLSAHAEQKVAALDAELAERCREMGIQEGFRPRLTCGWWGRGENAANARRVELRKVAERRVQADSRAAKLAIEAAALEVLTELTAAALTTDEARAFLSKLPTVAELMPTLDVRQLAAGK